MKKLMKTLLYISVFALVMSLALPLYRSADATSIPSQSNSTQSTTIKPPNPFDPFVISGSQRIKPAVEIHSLQGYKDGEIWVRGEGGAFKDPYWKNKKLPEITLDGTLEIYEAENILVEYIDVFDDPAEGKKTYKVSDVETFAPGRYKIECGASVWLEVNRDGIQYHRLYKYAFVLYIPEKGDSASTPSTTKPTTEPTTIATTKPTTIATTKPTTVSTAAPTTKATTVLTTKPATKPTTQPIPSTQADGASDVSAPIANQNSIYLLGTIALAAALITVTIVAHSRRKKADE